MSPSAAEPVACSAPVASGPSGRGIWLVTEVPAATTASTAVGGGLGDGDGDGLSDGDGPGGGDGDGLGDGDGDGLCEPGLPGRPGC
jgi:hypothetical protein